jgi:aspartyl-tRNA(Asn)/glutamyl-tRNA(Gln) amidotransferase subunit A
MEMESAVTALTRLTWSEARRALDRREISSLELTNALLDRLAALDPKVQAFLHPMVDVAREQARAADARIAAGQSEPMTGIPVALKDVLCTVDAPTTCGSRILEGYRSPFDATVVARLRAQGAVFVGKTNTDEFAMGSSTENSAYFTTHNPWDLSRVPGGSSGGSAAAVAAEMAILALGSDTGGSIRQPAGFCGVVGLKPTYGRVSRYGLVAFASSLDQIGPFARTVTDAAAMLRAIAGHDPLDSTSQPVPVPDYIAEMGRGIDGLVIGVPDEYAVAGSDPAVEAACQEAIRHLERLGARVRRVSLPHTKYALPTYYIVAPAEASANLARYDGMRYGLSVRTGTLAESYRTTRGEGFGAEVKRRIMLGTYALSSGYYDAYYIKAQKVRTLLKQDFDQAFAQVDVIVAPTSPTVAFAIGERSDDPLQMYLADVWTIPANMAGIPGIAVPCGFAHDLPVSLQFFGPAFGEATMLRAAYTYEQSTPWHTYRPPLDQGPLQPAG